jgi:hypothetical protein
LKAVENYKVKPIIWAKVIMMIFLKEEFSDYLFGSPIIIFYRENIQEDWLFNNSRKKTSGIRNKRQYGNIYNGDVQQLRLLPWNKLLVVSVQ